MSNDNLGRKEQILDNALELIAESGYENVSMKDIANITGIKASSIYNYYRSKESILTSLYDYYLEYFIKNRILETESKRIISEGTIRDIADIMPDGSFIKQEKHELKRMMLITKVIYTRMFFDVRAGEIYHITTERAKQNTKKKFDYGIEIGRFVPFDTYFYAHMYEVLYESNGLLAFSKPDHGMENLDIEAKLTKWANSSAQTEDQIIEWIIPILWGVENPLLSTLAN